MELLIVGSGTGVPSRRRSPAGYAVLTDDATLLLDCGPGTVGRLVQAGVDPTTIDHVFLSHHHPDHCADMVALIFANSLAPTPRGDRPLHVYGPRGTRQFIERLYDAFPSLEPTSWTLAVEDWDAGQVVADAWSVRSGPVVHGNVAAIGFSVMVYGHRLVYSGDTSECEEIVALAQDADTLLIEASYPDGTETRAHLTPSGAGRIATRAGASRVILTHLYPPCDAIDPAAQCARTYRGAIAIAADLARFTL